MSNVEMIPQYDTKLFTDIFDDAGSFVYYYKNIGIPTTISDANARTLYYLLYARYGNNPIANYDEEQFKYKIFSVVFQYGPTWEKRLSVQETLRNMSLSDLVDNGQLAELFSSQGSSSQTSSGTSGNTRTLNTQEANTGTQALARTGTDTTASTGTQALAKTGTDTTASTGTQALAHTGTVRAQADTEDIKNHAYNPGTAPAVDAYSPLTYINEQHATKNDVDNTTTYNNTDTTTNNLQNQTTHATTDTTTNNLQNQTTHATTDTTTNNLTKADTGTITDAGTTSGTVSGTDSKSNSTTTTMTAGKLKAYEKLLELLDSDVTGEFISKFKVCFKQFVIPEKTWIYVTEEQPMLPDDKIACGIIGTAVGAAGAGMSVTEIQAIVSIIVTVLGFIISVLIPLCIKLYHKIKDAKEDGVITKEELDDIASTGKEIIDESSKLIDEVSHNEKEHK